MTTYSTSTGERIPKSTIDRKIRDAKKQKIEHMLLHHGYVFCEDCGKSSGDYLDCSHTISVNDCQRNGKSELSWDVENIKIRCRTCHRKHDKN